MSDRPQSITPYSRGEYFSDPHRHAEDAPFKVHCFLKLFRAYIEPRGIQPGSLIDVGCGSGEVLRLLDRELSGGSAPTQLGGYDVSPHVEALDHPRIRFVHGDFSRSAETADVVTLFDVVEHVTDPVGFLRRVAERAKLLALHIPLENSLSVSLRNRFRPRLHDPGHLLYLDTASALNLLAQAGLRVVDFDYTLGFMAPSGHASLPSKLAWPLRRAVAALSPGLLSRTLGGTSLLVIALTPAGLADPDWSI